MTLSGTQIDSTARVDARAQLGEGVTIGPYCVIGPDVTIGEGCKLEAHIHVSGVTTIGARTVVFPFAALGGAPQSTGYRGGPTRLVIGEDCVIRESVTISRGTEDGPGVTELGHHGFYMACSHVAHDCRIGDHVVFANAAAVAGHCVVGDHVFMGGLSAAHQFTHIGSHAMIGGLSGLRGDVIPFGVVSGSTARMNGINVVGMRRRKFTAESVRAVRNAYRMLFLAAGPLDERIQALETAHGSDPAVASVLAFIRGPRKRPLCRARSGAAED